MGAGTSEVQGIGSLACLRWMIGRCLGSLASGFDDDQPALGLCQKSGWRGSIRTGKIRSGDVWPLNHKSCGVVGAMRFHAQLQGVGKESISPADAQSL